MTEKIKCPCCVNSFETDSEQAICVESFGECIFCRFSPNSKGSKSGTQAELSEIVVKQEVKRRFKNQQPKVIDMEKFVAGPVVVPTEEMNLKSAYQRGYLDGIGRDCPHCKDYKAMYIKVRDELAAEQQITQRQTSRIVDLQTHIENLEGED